jgi:hypothetical protein
MGSTDHLQPGSVVPWGQLSPDQPRDLACADAGPRDAVSLIMMTTTTIRFSAEIVQTHGLTIDLIRCMIAEAECPADVAGELNWNGIQSLVVTMTTDGDAASDELVECVERTGIPHMVAYIGAGS